MTNPGVSGVTRAKVIIKVPSDLTGNPGAIRPAADPSREWSFKRQTNDVYVATFHRQPGKPPHHPALKGELEKDARITLLLHHVEVSTTTGQAEIGIIEDLTVDTGPQMAETTLTVRKQETSPPEPDVPRHFRPEPIQPSYGKPARLVWEGPNIGYRILSAAHPAGVDVTGKRVWESHKLFGATTFVLQGLDNSDESNPVRHTLTTTVVPDRGLEWYVPIGSWVSPQYGGWERDHTLIGTWWIEDGDENDPELTPDARFRVWTGDTDHHNRQIISRVHPISALRKPGLAIHLPLGGGARAFFEFTNKKFDDKGGGDPWGGCLDPAKQEYADFNDRMLRRSALDLAWLFRVAADEDPLDNQDLPRPPS
ncbi:hypothetical protein ACLF6K_36750 [Streptomyces xanthophaeus]|uniref:hypothetical protein n=1 Tax=Streptomyces xanthophaeus TaxID=67385 RepID=UPI00398FCAB9